MADGVEIRITGLEEVRKALFSYSQQLGDRVVMAAVLAGAKFIQRAVKRAAPKKTGRLARSIFVKRSKINSTKRGDKVGVFVAIRRGKGRADPRDGFYGQWVVRGYNVRGKSKGGGGVFGRSDGRKSGRKSLPGKSNVAGRPFITDTFNTVKASAVEVVVRSLITGANIVKQRLGLK